MSIYKNSSGLIDIICDTISSNAITSNVITSNTVNTRSLIEATTNSYTDNLIILNRIGAGIRYAGLVFRNLSLYDCIIRDNSTDRLYFLKNLLDTDERTIETAINDNQYMDVYGGKTFSSSLTCDSIILNGKTYSSIPDITNISNTSLATNSLSLNGTTWTSFPTIPTIPSNLAITTSSNLFSNSNTFTGAVSMNSLNVISGLTTNSLSLNGTTWTSFPTIPTIPSNLAITNQSNTFSNSNTFTGAVSMTGGLNASENINIDASSGNLNINLKSWKGFSQNTDPYFILQTSDSNCFDYQVSLFLDDFVFRKFNIFYDKIDFQGKVRCLNGIYASELATDSVKLLFSGDNTAGLSILSGRLQDNKRYIDFGAYDPDVLYSAQFDDTSPVIRCWNPLGLGIEPKAMLHVQAYFMYGSGYRSPTLTGISAAQLAGYFNATVAASSFISYSDRRIKCNIVDIDDGYSLETIRKIKPKRYNYIDNELKGNDPVWGFIAQEVKDALPYSVTTRSDYIPNIYEFVKVNKGEITLQEKTTEQLKVGMNIRFVDIRGSCISKKIDKIIDSHTFSITEEFKANEFTDDRIFCFGIEVDDFHSLDKDAIFTVGISAIQEIDRLQQASVRETKEISQQIVSLTAENKSLQNTINLLNNTVSILKNDVQNMNVLLLNLLSKSS
jgi:hypothetical protein